MTRGLFPERLEAVAVGRFNPDVPTRYRARHTIDAPLRATREEAEADERTHP